MKDIILKIRRGELSRENDEKDVGGFWDLSREIALTQGIGYSEEMQEEIYNSLWSVYEEATRVPLGSISSEQLLANSASE